MSLQVGDVFPPEVDSSPRNRQQTRNAIEQRGLSGTIRSNETNYFTLIDVKVDSIESSHSKELLGQVYCFQ